VAPPLGGRVPGGLSVHVVLAGGGTAGHVEPALALADALRLDDPAIEITALGTDRGLETTLVPQRGYDLALVPPVPLPRRITPQLLTVPARLAGAVRGVRDILDRTQADVVAGFGGYVAMPAYLAARRGGVPIVVHEANARPGLANRVGARLTRHVALGSPATRLPHGRYIGIPLRRSVSTLDRAARHGEACADFGLDPQRTTLLVFGGSQGARHLNEVMRVVVADLLAADIQVLHAVGPKNLDGAAAVPEDGEGRYVVVPYLERMDLAYAAADLALCRAGALTCAELTAVGLPAVYVPLPIGNGEQRLNAEPIVHAGGGLVIDDAALTPDVVRQRVLPLLLDRGQLARMGDAAAALGRRDADTTLAAMVQQAATAMARESSP
jgi:UDP-N-acetylglucosamine--N-acetylmuramyl-(pentapeptide) pyrophosphoryl-undecaprenol N-acetylglucosamine transferase